MPINVNFKCVVESCGIIHATLPWCCETEPALKKLSDPAECNVL